MTRQSRTTAARSRGETGPGREGDRAAGDERSRRAESAQRRRTASDPAAGYWERLRTARPDAPESEGRGPRQAGEEPSGGAGHRGPAEEPSAADWERLRDPRWFAGEAGSPPPTGQAPSLTSVIALLEAVRSLVPRELERQFNALLREALLTLRAVIDWYLERLDGGRRDQRVEDIPIE